MTVEPSVLRPARVLASATLASRVLGLLRDVAAARLFGASLVWDAFIVAFTIPNLARRLLGEGALASAFVPVMVEHDLRRSPEEGRLLFRSTLGWLCLTLLALLIALEALTLLGLWSLDAWPALRAALAERDKLESWRETLRLTAWLLPYLACACLTALAGAALNARNHFLAPAVAPVLLNLGFLAGLFLLGPVLGATDRERIMGVVAGVLFSGLLGVAIQIPPLRRAGLGARPSLARPPGLTRVAGQMGPMVLGVAALEINTLADRLIALALVPATGAVSALYFANRFLQFPMAVVGISLAQAAYPALAGHAAEGDLRRLGAALERTGQRLAHLCLPASLGLVLLARPIVELLFRGQAFDERAAERTAAVLMAFGLSVWPVSAIQLLARAHYALGDSRLPARAAAWMAGLNLVLSIALVFPLQELGLALATTLASVAQFLVLHRGLARPLGEGRPRLRQAFPPYRCLGLLALAAATLAPLALLSDDLIWQRALRVVLPILAGAGAYMACTRLAGRRLLTGDRKGSGGHAAGPIAGSAGACSRGTAAEAPGPFGSAE